MSDTDTSSPAGESTGASAPESLSLTAAAERLGQIEQASAEAKPDEQRQTDPSEPDDASQPADGPEDDGNDGEPAEPAAEPEQPAEPEEGVELDRLHGNTKVRLRDGTEWTVGELKRRLDDVRQVDQARQDFETQRTAFQSEQSQFQQAAAQLAQRAQFFEQIAPQAIAAIQAQLPDLPEPPRYNPNDPFAYVQEKAEYDAIVADYNGKVAQIQQIQHAQAEQARERQQHQQQATEGFIKEQQRLLFDAIPELQDKAKRQAFEADFLKHGTETYGFTVDELGSTYDHRLIRMAKDAIAYRELMSRPAKPAQPAPKPTVPVAQPGRRVTGQEAATARTQELRSRVNKPGGLSMSEAASLLSQIED